MTTEEAIRHLSMVVANLEALRAVHGDAECKRQGKPEARSELYGLLGSMRNRTIAVIRFLDESNGNQKKEKTDYTEDDDE